MEPLGNVLIYAQYVLGTTAGLPKCAAFVGSWFVTPVSGHEARLLSSSEQYPPSGDSRYSYSYRELAREGYQGIQPKFCATVSLF